jgi:hypothetical protein
VYPPGR